jgi:hypothetical protein
VETFDSSRTAVLERTLTGISPTGVTMFLHETLFTLDEVEVSAKDFPILGVVPE